MHEPNFLQTLWFGLIGVLWIGYFVLEGFDFGVGMLIRALGRDETDKRMIIHTIGPVWDGNEVWLLTAGGATFAAFPGWYASLFSGFYLALFLILAALIIRGVSFEFWGKDDSPRWRATWEWTAVIGSFLAALLWGVGWANIVHGVPMNADHNVTASLFDLLHPYALLGGLVTLSLFLSHGAIFLSLRTRGEMVERARAVAQRASIVTVVLMAGFVLWTVLDQDNGGGKLSAQAIAVLAVGLAATVPFLIARQRDGWGFALSAGAIALLFTSLFVWLYPDALPSSTAHAYDLTLPVASASHYSQTVMTVVAVIFVPIVLAYQGWTYWVFRHRLGRDDFEGTPTPIAVLQSLGSGNGGQQDERPAAPDPSSPAA
jgi:cytochrome bd ubiquinol oxidase subunit II